MTMDIMLAVLGVIFIGAPTAYRLSSGQEMTRKHAILYTIGWLASLPFVALWAYGAVLVERDRGYDPVLDVLIAGITFSILSYPFAVFISIAGGWTAFLSGKLALAEILLSLPLFNAGLHLFIFVAFHSLAIVTL